MSAEPPLSIPSIPVLIVDDEPVILDSLSSFLKLKGWDVACAGSAGEALADLRQRERPIVITDVNMPDMDGLSLLAEIKREFPQTEVVIMTGIGTEELAIRALRAGAADYFRKPIKGPEVQASLLRCQRMMEVKSQNESLKALVFRQAPHVERDIVLGESPASRDTLARLKRLADAQDTTVLLIGDTGVGKEVAARLLHYWSKPADAPFVAINCGGVVESLLERELFGHERGAFTGAEKRSPGVFEMGIGGTILLDEITELSIGAQSRLLRVLEERTFRRVGGTADIPLRNARVIATTNKELQAKVSSGEFREDLFFRLNVVPIRLAPLRERPEEIPVLARSFLTRMKGEAYTFSAEAEAALGRYAYPGNIRELKNIVEYAAIFSAGPTIQPADLAPVLPLGGGSPPLPAPGPAGPAPSGLNLREQEVALIRQALGASPGNHSASARSLGITPQALYRRMKKYGLD